MGAASMGGHVNSDVPESDVIVAPAKKDVALPGENFIVTPATKEEPLPDEVQAGEDRSVSFQDQTYTFPSTATDDQIFEFLNRIPVKGEEEQEPPEPLREREVIKKDEGVRKDKEGEHISYLDTVKVLTGGRGHVLTKEEKKLYPKGAVIPEELVDSWFKADMEEADVALTELLEEKAVHVPDEVFDILLNMSFNLGKSKLKKFKKMWAAVEIEDWATAAVEMEDSKWFKQVKNRAVLLVGRMAALAPATETVASEETTDKLTPAKGGLFEDENGKLFMVDDQGIKTEV